MNSIGTVFRISIWGESHGPALGVIIDGCPAGIAISPSDMLHDIERRKAGARGTTPRIEQDTPLFLSGVYNGYTTGAPILISFENTNTRSADYKQNIEIPRPGHADFVLSQKFRGFNDHRGGGHSSGRLTLALVAAGALAKKLSNDICIAASVTEAGGDTNIDHAIEQAIERQDSIGGVVSCSVTGLPAGLGEPFFDSVESKISHAVFSIPAIKAIEFGSGFASAKMVGSEHNDAIIAETGTTATNHAGGVNGGITNGNELYFRVFVKPASSTPQQQLSWNTVNKKIKPFQIKGRHDLCIALRVPAVIEAVTAIVFADLLLMHQAYKR